MITTTCRRIVAAGLRLLSLGILFFTISAAITSPNVAASVAADGVPPELGQYLAQSDDSFRWEILEKDAAAGTYLLEMTSQTWHGIPWKHFVLVTIPKNPTLATFATIHIGGKSTGRPPSDGEKLLSRTIAESTGMTQVMLFQVPNQPLFGNYYEDALIGETLLKAIETEDSTWPILFPMAKAAIRTIDTVEQLLAKEWNVPLKGVVISGASKRGWTTWLAGASGDPRIIAIAPVVIDNLNTLKQMQYQIETWGQFSSSIHDYTTRNLVRKNSSEMTDYEHRLWKMIDPYFYRSRLTMPKLLVHGTNDPYWTVDAARHYWDDLTEPKYLLTIPNVGHGLDSGLPKAVQTLAAFSQNAAKGGEWPKMTWKLEEKRMSAGNGDQYVVRVDTEIPYTLALLWTATSDTADFRQAKWKSQELSSASKVVEASITKPTTGHVAFFIEICAVYDDKIPFSLTTQVWRK